MKRTTKLFAVAIAVAAATISAPRAGSSEPTKFLLTVENGNASGNYAAGTLVVVRANAPQAGAEFEAWTGDIAILSNPLLPETTAIIPSQPVTITATYTPAFNPFLILDAILEGVWGG